MNRKGFSLIDLLASIALMGFVLCIGLFSSRETLARTISRMNEVSNNEIYNVTREYVFENQVKWINDGDEYTYVMINDLVDEGYFSYDEVRSYRNKKVKVVRDPKTKTIKEVQIIDKNEE